MPCSFVNIENVVMSSCVRLTRGERMGSNNNDQRASSRRVPRGDPPAPERRLLGGESGVPAGKEGHCSSFSGNGAIYAKFVRLTEYGKMSDRLLSTLNSQPPRHGFQPYKSLVGPSLRQSRVD